MEVSQCKNRRKRKRTRNKALQNNTKKTNGEIATLGVGDIIKKYNEKVYI